MSNLSPQQFDDYELRYSADDREDTGALHSTHLVSAYHGDERVGYLHWAGRTGTVLKVDVDDDHQRRGLATAMWNHANSLPGVKKPRHAAREDRTPEGAAWVKAVGGLGARG